MTDGQIILYTTANIIHKDNIKSYEDVRSTLGGSPEVIHTMRSSGTEMICVGRQFAQLSGLDINQNLSRQIHKTVFGPVIVLPTDVWNIIIEGKTQ